MTEFGQRGVILDEGYQCSGAASGEGQSASEIVYGVTVCEKRWSEVTEGSLWPEGAVSVVTVICDDGGRSVVRSLVRSRLCGW